MDSTTIRTAILNLITNAIALAVAFGANLNTGQQAAILGFVGTVTTGITLAVAWYETTHVKAKAMVLSAKAPLTANELKNLLGEK